MLLFSSRYQEKKFKLDPHFPDLLYSSGISLTLRFLQSFLEDYSKRGLSVPTDRAIALSGLAARIARALHCKEEYGIFGLFLHRTLLWQRLDLHNKMKRIDYKAGQVPSWSWMAYAGGIEFTKFDFGDFDLFDNLKFVEGDESALITDVWGFQDCSLAQEAESKVMSYQILDQSKEKRGRIVYDVEGGTDISLERCVVVARTHRRDGQYDQTLDGTRYYILVVKQRLGTENEYERVGIGEVQEGYVSREQCGVRMV
jgi:hypothetical protein